MTYVHIWIVYLIPTSEKLNIYNNSKTFESLNLIKHSKLFGNELIHPYTWNKWNNCGCVVKGSRVRKSSFSYVSLKEVGIGNPLWFPTGGWKTNQQKIPQMKNKWAKKSHFQKVFLWRLWCGVGGKFSCSEISLFSLRSFCLVYEKHLFVRKEETGKCADPSETQDQVFSDGGGFFPEAFFCHLRFATFFPALAIALHFCFPSSFVLSRKTLDYIVHNNYRNNFLTNSDRDQVKW